MTNLPDAVANLLSAQAELNRLADDDDRTTQVVKELLLPAEQSIVDALRLAGTTALVVGDALVVRHPRPLDGPPVVVLDLAALGLSVAAPPAATPGSNPCLLYPIPGKLGFDPGLPAN
jgi:hypothetical protein